MAKNQYPKELIKFLQDNPKVQYVYLNEDGGWLARRHPAFRTQTNREVILATAKATEKETKEQP